MLLVLKIARPMRFSSRDPVEGPSAYGPFTRCSVDCCCSVEFLTPDEAKDPGFTIIGIYSPSMPYDAGIETVRIWMPNFPFWRPTSDISIFPELSVTLHLTAELFPEITARADAAFGDVIPQRREP